MSLRYAYDQITMTRDAVIGWIFFEGNDLGDIFHLDFAQRPNGRLEQWSVKKDPMLSASRIGKRSPHFAILPCMDVMSNRK
jgi:hypothetical protein